MMRNTLLLTCVALLACTPVPASEGEDGGVTTNPSSGGVTSVDEGTEDEGPDPSTTTPGTTTPGTTTTTGPGPILDLDGGNGGIPWGGTCVSDDECASGQCYVIPFLGGYCGECNEDADCPDGGCTAPNPFDSGGSLCNLGELGGGCESDEACQQGLECSTALDLLGLITINTCGSCRFDSDCPPGQLCAPQVDLPTFSGVNSCIPPGAQGQDSYCNLEGNGDAACASGICSILDIMGIAEIGACGQCVTDDDCNGGTCSPGFMDLDIGTLHGSTCG